MRANQSVYRGNIAAIQATVAIVRNIVPFDKHPLVGVGGAGHEDGVDLVFTVTAALDVLALVLHMVELPHSIHQLVDADEVAAAADRVVGVVVAARCVEARETLAFLRHKKEQATNINIYIRKERGCVREKQAKFRRYLFSTYIRGCLNACICHR